MRQDATQRHANGAPPLDCLWGGPVRAVCNWRSLATNCQLQGRPPSARPLWPANRDAGSPSGTQTRRPCCQWSPSASLWPPAAHRPNKINKSPPHPARAHRLNRRASTLGLSQVSASGWLAASKRVVPHTSPSTCSQRLQSAARSRVCLAASLP